MSIVLLPFTNRSTHKWDVVISHSSVIQTDKFQDMLGYRQVLLFSNKLLLHRFYIPGNTKNVKLVHARIRRNHGKDAEDDHLLALLHRSVWHQQTPILASSSKHVSLYPGVRKHPFSNTCWAEKINVIVSMCLSFPFDISESFFHNYTLLILYAQNSKMIDT